MTTNAELRALAEAAGATYWTDGQLRRVAPLGETEARFIAAANPQRILALLNENAELRAQLEAMNDDGR